MHRISNFARGNRVTFTFERQQVEGFERESIATAILVSGRTVLARSIRYHRPRTMFCSTGECGWCALEVDGVANVHACTVLCREGLVARSQNAWPSAEWDVFRLLDLFSSYLSNTFYHRQLLRPTFMQQLYLRMLRLFTGSGRLYPNEVKPVRRQKVNLGTDAVVVGCGLAGMSAAVTLAERGVRVILIDDRDLPGGSWPARAGAPSAWKELAEKITSHPNVEYWSHSVCLGIYEQNTLGIVTPHQLVTVHARHIILAPGGREAPQLFTNNDLPGVLSARLVERLITVEGIAPGKSAVVWGSPSPTTQLTTIMQQAGIETIHQLQPDEIILAAQGSGKVTAALIGSTKSIPRMIPCDLIVVAGLQPRNELLAQAGVQMLWDEKAGGLRATRGGRMQTSVPGLWLVGEAAGLVPPDRCQVEGRLAGLSALQDMGFDELKAQVELLTEQVIRMELDSSIPFPANSPEAQGHVCFCEDVRENEIYHQMQTSYDVPELIKRRTGVLTGPCQGKFCLANVMRASGHTSGSPTARPPAKPIRLKDLVAD